MQDVGAQSGGKAETQTSLVMLLQESPDIDLLTTKCLRVLQDLIKSAAEQGSPEVIGILLDQPLFKKDKDELDEAVDTGESTTAKNTASFERSS